MKVDQLALSSRAFPIFIYQFGDQPNYRPVLILGGVHGNEPEGVWAANALMGRLSRDYNFKFSTYIIPCFNPDGFFSGTRTNGNNVDLNRNLPTRDWNPKAFNAKYPPGESPNSEVENQALTGWLDRVSPHLIISLHSFERYLMNINGECRELAEAMQRVNSYPIEESIGYPTPGCLGTYAGLERSMPTITYEIERGSDLQKVLDLHLPSLMEVLKEFERIGDNART